MKTWIVLLLCLFLFPWEAQSAEYYRWTDENGVSHITDQPPPTAKKNLKTYRFRNQVQSVAPETTGTETTSGTVGGGQSYEMEAAQTSNAELEQTRAEYEELQGNEAHYRRNYYNAYGNKHARDYWKGRLNDLENKRQKLESFESGESSDQGFSSGSTESSEGVNPM
ncbi:MAG: DUF4124 domain-containing protein [Syntrophales bacterium]|jgi:hypothetical protein|nr:DUF4124 domain-containing protein [Syntrophales bacterium]